MSVKKLKNKVIQMGSPGGNLHRIIIIHGAPDFTPWGFIENQPEGLRDYANSLCRQAIELSLGVEVAKSDGQLIAEPTEEDGSNQCLNFRFPYLQPWSRTKGVKVCPLDLSIDFSSSECTPDIEVIFNLEQLLEDDIFPEETLGFEKRLRKFAKELRRLADKIDANVTEGERFRRST